MARTPFGKRIDRMVKRSPRLMRINLALEAMLMRLAWAGFRRLSVDQASALGGQGLAMLGPRLRKTRHIRANLRHAFPQASEAALERHVREVWRTLGRVIAEYPHLGAIAEGRYGPRIEEVFQPGATKETLAQGPVLFVGGHCGNWELAGVTTYQPTLPMTLIYSPQRNVAIDAMLLAWRQGLGMRYVPKGDGLVAMRRALSEGRSIGLLLDQRVDGGEPLPFFGHEAWTATVPFRLAVRSGMPIVPVRVERLEGVRFRITVHRPLRPDPTLTDARDQARHLASAMNRIYEQWIRERPGQWMCLKRRWPEKPSAQPFSVVPSRSAQADVSQRG